ncbi:MAG: hypothetical protein FWG25_11385, partial [Promicromonosporaceae bacterium]|nr:hypothetical protein [Promicromonosporaceae bacterium]
AGPDFLNYGIDSGFYLDDDDDAGRPTRWFATSDLGRWDAEGKLEVLGRLDDVILTGGVNVHPGRVEEAVASALPYVWPGVRFTALCAVGVPDEKWGQCVIVVGESQNAHGEISPETLATLRAHLRDTGALATAELPKQVIAVSELPRLPSGKADRRAVARLAAKCEL